jgi:GH25 family lysozyme M1 (1,4-beta-N-acetylmuramidase)
MYQQINKFKMGGNIMSEVKLSGIDVSMWQATIDWAKVKASGVQFAIIRGGYGNAVAYPGQMDPYFERNYAECKKYGIPVGMYWYSYATNEAMAKQEAQACLNACKGKQFEMPILYDVEETRIFTSGKTNQIIKAWADILEAAKYFVGIYCYRSAVDAYLSSDVKNRYSMAIAEYGPKLNYNGPVGIWQNSSTEHYNGINGNVDHDYCYVDYPAIIKNGGFNGYTKSSTDVKPAPKPAPSPAPAPKPAKKSNDQIANEVIRGNWGAGDDRRKKLTAAGYNYDIIQAIVNQKLGVNVSKPAKKSNDQIANEVIRGDWGAGDDRRKRLTAAGYNYDTIQAIVNKKMDM